MTKNTQHIEIDKSPYGQLKSLFGALNMGPHATDLLEAYGEHCKQQGLKRTGGKENRCLLLKI